MRKTKKSFTAYMDTNTREIISQVEMSRRLNTMTHEEGKSYAQRTMRITLPKAI